MIALCFRSIFIRKGCMTPFRTLTLFVLAFQTLLFAAPTSAHLRTLLQEERFDLLDKELRQVQQAYERGDTDERALVRAYYAFRNSDPELDEHLRHWRSAMPDSCAALTATGAYHHNLGWMSRGGRYVSETPSEQFERMHAHFDIAAPALAQAVALCPTMLPAYSDLISISKATGNREGVRRWHDRGLSAAPGSIHIRFEYLRALEPRWGGSMEAIRHYLKSLPKLSKKYPRLRELDGYLDYLLAGRVESGDGNTCRKNVAYYSTALKKGEQPLYRLDRAKAYRCLGEWENAIEDYNRVLELYPELPGALAGRGMCYDRLGQKEHAMADLNRAVENDRMDPYPLFVRGQMYYNRSEPDKAFKDFRDSLIYGYEYKKSYLYLGLIHYYHYQEYKKAAEMFKKSIELGENDQFVWYNLTLAQWRTRDCDFVQSARRYLAACEKEECKASSVEWTRKSADYAVSSGLCKAP